RENERYSEATQRTLQECGVSLETLSAADLARRYPQMHVDGAYAILEPESGAILARRAVAAVVEDAGVDYMVEAVRPPQDGEVRTRYGETLRATSVVFA